MYPHVLQSWILLIEHVLAVGKALDNIVDVEPDHVLRIRLLLAILPFRDDVLLCVDDFSYSDEIVAWF